MKELAQILIREDAFFSEDNQEVYEYILCRKFVKKYTSSSYDRETNFCSVTNKRMAKFWQAKTRRKHKSQVRHGPGSQSSRTITIIKKNIAKNIENSLEARESLFSAKMRNKRTYRNKILHKN